MIKFEKDSLVTTLPCERRHYFHTQCFEEWMTINPSCPVCQVEVTAEEIDGVARVYRKKLADHIKCCYNSDESSSEDLRIDEETPVRRNLPHNQGFVGYD